MTDAPERPDRAAIVECLRALLGGDAGSEDLALEWREWRWMSVGRDRVVLVAASDQGWRRLEREAVLLAAAGDTVGRRVPRVLVEDAELRMQVRNSMSGLHGHGIEAWIFGIPEDPPLPPAPRFSPDCSLTPWGETFARDLGRTFARFHRAMTAEQGLAAGFVPYRMDWDAVERVLADNDGLEHLRRAAPLVRAWDESHRVEDVVIHGDPHLYNIFVSPQGEVSGLIDFGDAGVGDRHEDLRYLHSDGPRFAALAMEAYAAEAGAAVDADTVARYHVRSAFDHFAWIEPSAPRFPEIVEWTSAALKALTPQWAVSRIG